MVDVILDRAGQKGTGKWSVIEAQHAGVPATAIEAAVAARSLSSIKEEREAAETAYGKGGATRSSRIANALLDDLELALFAGKIAAYAQGFAVMEAASKEFSWNLPMPTIAQIWRAGCIIRSQFLDTIASAFAHRAAATNLLMAPAFVAMMKEAHPSLRRIVAAARRKRPAGSGAVVGARLFRQLPPGPRHREPHPGAARFLRRPRLRAHRRGRRLPRPLGQRSGRLAPRNRSLR